MKSLKSDLFAKFEGSKFENLSMVVGGTKLSSHSGPGDGYDKETSNNDWTDSSKSADSWNS